MDDAYDFVVVGTGIGGLTAATVARDQGLTVCLVERSAYLGGVLAVTQGEVWVAGNHLESQAGIEDSPALARHYLHAMAAGYAEERQQHVLLDNAPRALAYLATAGVRWKLCRGMPDYYFGKLPGTLGEGRYIEVEPIAGNELGEWRSSIRTSPFFPSGVTGQELYGWGGYAGLGRWDQELIRARLEADELAMGAGLASYLLKAAVIDRAIPVMLGTRAQRLQTRAGRVTGLEVCAADGTQRSLAAHRGVLLATGGYEWDPVRTLKYEQLRGYRTLCPPIVTGDGMEMAEDAGADVVALPPIGQASVFGYGIPGERFEGQPLWRLALEAGLPHAIIVNQAGERFCDESFYRDHQAKFRAFDNKRQTYRNLPAYLIIDSQFRERYPLGPYPPDQPLPTALAFKADSLDALATAAEIDASALRDTVAGFNAGARAGTDPDFGRGEYRWSNVFVGDQSDPIRTSGPSSAVRSGRSISPSAGAGSTPPVFGSTHTHEYSTATAGRSRGCTRPEMQQRSPTSGLATTAASPTHEA